MESSKKYKLCSCFYLFLFFFLTSVAADPQTESLLSLKSHLTDNSNSLKDWFIITPGVSDKALACCSWSGVRCNQDSTSVVSLDLSSKNLAGDLPGNELLVFTDLLELNISDNSFSGEFPAEIFFNLTNLRSLDISRNNFSGRFPDGNGGGSSLKNLIFLDALSNSFSGPLPIHLSQLENLKVLNLAGSYFTGSIPSQYGSFKSLEFLHLGGNLLSGHIPQELGNLTTLTHMEIGYNSYQGVIPWQIGYMSELKYLDIAGANLSGFIPKHFSNLTKLESLFLFKNHLSKEIPWELGQITSLVNLDLSDNHLSGTIPESFAGFKNLRLLNLMYNEMSGTLPEVIAQLPSLDTLFIWNNYFSGSLPKSLGMNSKLRWVDVSTNSFQGEIPQGICSRGVLYKLMLFSNNFTGALPQSLSNCSTLVRIRLEDNSFSGVIPFSFSQLPDISYIDLSRNKLAGGIPLDISKATKLDYFNISNNPELGGKLPPQIWSAPRLQNFSASSCSISGPLPEFASCKSITVIELRNNDISGMLTPTVSTCGSLQKIDLAGNSITGGIPERFAKLPHLTVLDFSYNNLSGSIPSDKVFQSMGKHAYEGNANLCGIPLKSCSAYSSRKLVSVVVACLVSILLMLAATLALYYIRQRSQGQWKMVSFAGLPQFTADDVLRSFGSPEPTEAVPASVSKAVLPTGITVIVRKIELLDKKKSVVLNVLTQMGNARHVNLVRLLGFCYNNHLVYVLYDNNLHTETLAEKMRTKKKDWATKKRIINGVAKGLCFLHHECYPTIPHGDLRSTNILFDDDKMEPCLGEFGFKYMQHLNKGLVSSTANTADQMNVIREEQQKDIYNFGQLILEILTNGKLMNAGGMIQNKPKDVLLREVYTENEVSSSDFKQGEVKRVVEVALLCIRSNQSDRPCMENVLKFLSEADNRFK
ncbi:PREDICTED: leucine-rich repeat receptor-like protein kinase TDR isoform X1 [Camelina sativa]|uniref:Leucine-rich repeat receptor-like protein kinase TDR isoform X1 n=1 Tax=Camelina sativa TaxID=90675 RepID=A0ABM0UKV4_CAMSA|nr:PREDICTED: leucine-rich repeat receptor-like protein kinase TDR isoform X1 [Camelina sativa]